MAWWAQPLVQIRWIALEKGGESGYAALQHGAGMNNPWALDDLLADLYHARKNGDLGRMAFVAYCDVRRWAREEGRNVLAEQAAGLITQSPHQSRDNFLEQIDALIGQLEALQRAKSAPPAENKPVPTFWPTDPHMA